MLYPIGVQIPFAAGFTASKVGATGLTVYVSIVRQASDGSRTVVIALASNTAATEVDATNQPGVYSYLLAGASTGTAGYYFATFHTAGTADTKDITALEIVGAAWVQAAATDLDATISSRNATAPDNTSIATILARTDVATSTRSSHSAADVWAVGTRTLTSFGTLVADVAAAVWAAATRTLTAFGFPVTLATGAVSITAPVASTGDITLTAGNDYGPSPANLPRVLISLSAGAAPDLTGATVSLGIQNNATTYAGTVITASPTGAQVIEIPLTAVQTTALAATLGSGAHRYTVDITTATGSKVQSVATGSLTVRPRP